MSRSYKHTPRSGDKKDKYLKNYANRRLRRYPINKPPLNNCTYKKYNCSWEICDYWNYQPGPFLYLRWHIEEENEEVAFWRWYKNCKMK